MPEIEMTVQTVPVDMTDEMMEIEAMYAEICEMWSM